MSLTPKSTKRVLNPSASSAFDDTTLAQLISVTKDNPVDVLQFARMSIAFIDNLRKDVNMSARAGSSANLVLVAKRLFDAFGPGILNDDGLLDFVVTKSGLDMSGRQRNKSRLKRSLQFLADNNLAFRRGRKAVHSTEFFNAIHDEVWLKNSIPTVDRRNGRDCIFINQDIFQSNYTDKYGISVKEDYMEEHLNKRNKPQYKALRRITTCTYGRLQSIVLKEYGVQVSIGVLFACKPFFCLSVSHPLIVR